MALASCYNCLETIQRITYTKSISYAIFTRRHSIAIRQLKVSRVEPNKFQNKSHQHNDLR